MATALIRTHHHLRIRNKRPRARHRRRYGPAGAARPAIRMPPRDRAGSRARAAAGAEL